MKRKSVFLVSLFFVSSLVVVFASPPKVIVIDPGHGGKDPGASYKGVEEKTICLDVGLKVRDLLTEQFPKIKIALTRDSDVFNHVTEKAEMANKLKGQLFVSIHVNASGLNSIRKYKYVNKPYYTTVDGRKVKKYKKVKQYYTVSTYNHEAEGVEVYIWASDRTDNKSEAITSSLDQGEEQDADDGGGENNQSEYAQIPDLNSPEAKLLSTIYAQRFFQSSFHIATLIDEELKKIGRISHGVKQRNNKGIWVLQATAMPAVLVELGYLTNEKEAKYMTSEEGQNELASAIVSAISRYISHN